MANWSFWIINHRKSFSPWKRCYAYNIFRDNIVHYQHQSTWCVCLYVWMCAIHVIYCAAFKQAPKVFLFRILDSLFSKACTKTTQTHLQYIYFLNGIACDTMSNVHFSSLFILHERDRKYDDKYIVEHLRTSKLHKFDDNMTV